MDVTLAVATGFVYWEATHVFWKGYQCVSWEGGELETKSMWTKYLCDNGVSSFLRYISFETQEPQAPLEENKYYGKYHIILSEAGCEG